MASVKQLVDGLEILAKTASVPAGLAEQGVTDVREAEINGASHDVVCGPDADPDESQVVRLEELGWHFDDEYDCWSLFV